MRKVWPGAAGVTPQRQQQINPQQWAQLMQQINAQQTGQVQAPSQKRQVLMGRWKDFAKRHRFLAQWAENLSFTVTVVVALLIAVALTGVWVVGSIELFKAGRFVLGGLLAVGVPIVVGTAIHAANDYEYR